MAPRLDEPSAEAASAPNAPLGLAPDRAPSDAAQPVVDRVALAQPAWARFSVGGRWLFGYSPGRLAVFEAAHGRLLLERPLYGSPPCGGASALTPNGRRMLLTRGGGDIRLVNIWTMDTVRAFEMPENGPYRCTLSQDGTRVVVAGAGTVQVWDPAQETPLKVLAAPTASGIVRVLADRRADTLVVAARQEGRLVGWAYGGDGGRRWRSLGALVSIRRLLLSPDGAWLADRQGALKSRLIDTWSGKAAPALDARDVHAFLNNGQQLLLGDGRGKLSRWDRKAAQAVGRHDIGPGVDALAVSPDGKKLGVLGHEAGVRHLAVWVFGEPQARVERHFDALKVRALSWRRSLELLVGDADITVNPASGKAAGPPTSFQPDEVLAGFQVGHRWGGRVRSLFHGRDVAFVDEPTGRMVWSTRLSERVADVVGTADVERPVAALLRSGGVVTLGADGAAQPTWERAARALAIAAHPTEAVVALAESDGRIVGRALSDGAERWALDAPPARRPRLAFAESGRYLARCASRRCLLVALDQGGAREVTTTEVLMRFDRLALSPDGTRLAVSDGTAVWTVDAETGRRRARIVPVPGGRVVTIGDGVIVLDDAARAFVRWRGGLDHIARGGARIREVWKAWRKEAWPL